MDAAQEPGQIGNRKLNRAARLQVNFLSPASVYHCRAPPQPPRFPLFVEIRKRPALLRAWMPVDLRFLIAPRLYLCWKADFLIVHRSATTPAIAQRLPSVVRF